MDTAQLRGARVAGEIGRDCLAVRVRLLNRAVTRIYDAALRPHGLTIAQLNLLTSIAARQPAPAGEVARLLSMEISTLSRNARLLHEDGLIRIERAEHGNGRIFTLTDAGAGKLSELRPAWRSAQRRAQTLLGEDAAHSIKQLVDGMFAEQPTTE
ncbi:MAG TPA: MarR family transcriptional regulator [Solirubrobacteraceae bacterium]|nr:MarR family transcriptional regulator [Solirubrobacteraceae bacterium]